MEFLEIFDLIRRRVWMIAGLCIVAAVSGYITSYLVPQTYEASALVLVRPQKPVEIVTSTNKELLDFPVTQSMSVETPGKTYIEIITSNELVGKVVSELGLDQEEEETSEEDGAFWKFLDEVKEQIKTYMKNFVQYLKYGQIIEKQEFESAIEEVQENLSLETQADTFVFTITYSGDDPQTAAEIANTMAELFVQYMRNLHQSESVYVVDQLTARLLESEKQLVVSRQRLEEFKRANEIFDQDVEYAESLDVISQLEVVLENMEAELAVNPDTLSNRNLAARRDALLRSIEERKAELVGLPELERALSFLRLDVDVARSAYEAIAKELEELEIKSTVRAPEIRMVSHAVPPNLPTKPIRIRFALLALITALVVGTGLAFFLEYIDQKIRGVEDVERILGVRVLATIPRFPPRWQW